MRFFVNTSALVALVHAKDDNHAPATNSEKN